MRDAKPHGLREVAEPQLVFHLRVHEVFHPSQAGGTEPASMHPYWSVAHSIPIDQCRSQSLLHRIEKQAPTWKPGNPFRIHGSKQRTQSRIRHLPSGMQLYAPQSIARSYECSIRNADNQVLHIGGSNPLLRKGRAQPHFTRVERGQFQRGAPGAQLHGARPEQHAESVLPVDLKVRLLYRPADFGCYSHFSLASCYAIRCPGDSKEYRRFGPLSTFSHLPTIALATSKLRIPWGSEAAEEHRCQGGEGGCRYRQVKMPKVRPDARDTDTTPHL